MAAKEQLQLDVVTPNGSVLSVVAQQILSILTAITQGKERFVFPNPNP